MSVFKKVTTRVIATSIVIGLLAPSSMVAYAKSNCNTISPTMYELNEDSKYEFISSEKCKNSTPAGSLSVNGERYTVATTGSIPDFAVKKDYIDQSTDYNLSLSYVYDGSLLNASD